ncbi:MAG: transporter substrate-binding domain-containing protein, partial [Gammaproteobacteria bacterium]
MLHYFSAQLKLMALTAAIALAAAPGHAQDEDEAEKDFAVPAFRHVDPTAPVPALRDVGTIRFITDDNFPPFSYRDAFGSLTGFNVMLAEAVCADLRLACEFVARPWEELMPALEAGEGDAVLGGLAMSRETLQTADFTRPYYRTLGRFAVRAGTMSAAELRTLADKRVGVIAGTAHEAFLQTYFSQADIQAFDDTSKAREALRTGELDALFDDAVRHMFWLDSPASRGCCSFAGGAYLDPEYFSRPLAIAVERDNERLLEVLDYGLDRVQVSGDYAKVYRLFF